MAGYSVSVNADISQAKRSFEQLQRIADKATRARKIAVNVINVKAYGNAFKSAGKAASTAVKTVYTSTEAVRDSVGRLAKDTDPKVFLTGSFESATRSAMKLVDVTAKVTIAFYGINAAVGVLKRSFGGFWSQTIGQAARFEETLLKTKTTLASTNDVFVNGQKITDPLEKINALNGSIDKRVESIRRRTLDLAGVTSGQVVEVFGVVASQAGQIGINLKQAEDLAINFAGALGTFGIPLRQARQEVTSILQGNISVDSYLAKALNIKSEDIQKAKSQVGGVAKFLEERLGTAVAGQALAARGLAGVTSNIVEVWEEFTRAIGTTSLDPLLNGLTLVYQVLIKSLSTITDIGGRIGKIGATIGTGLAGAAGFNSLSYEDLFKDATGEKLKESSVAVFNQINTALGALNAKLSQMMDSLSGAFSSIFGVLAGSIANLTKAFSELASVVVDLSLAQFESLVGTLAAVAPLLGGTISYSAELIRLWANFLKLPIVEGIVRMQVTFKLLEATGVIAFATLITKIVLFKGIVLAAIRGFFAMVQKVKVGIGMILKALGTLMVTIGRATQAFISMGVATGAVSKKAAFDMAKLNAQLVMIGKTARKSGLSIATMGVGVKSLAGKFKGFIKANLWLIAVQLALVALVEIVSAFQRHASRVAEDKKLQKSIKLLDDTAEKAASGGLSSLEKRLRDIATSDLKSKIDELTSSLKENLDKQVVGEITIGGHAGRNARRAQIRLADLIKQQKKEIAELEAKLGENNAKADAEIRAKNEKKLVKEIAALKRQQEDAVFNKRMEVARKEVDLFRAIGQQKIREMDLKNKKLIEGEEGASRTALEALNRYLVTRKKGELDAEAAKQQLQLTMQSREKLVEDYRFKIQESINKLRKKIGQFELEVGKKRIEQANEEAAARSGTGTSKSGTGTSKGVYVQGGIGPKGPNEYGAHFDIARVDGQHFDRSALDQFVQVNGRALSSGTTVNGGQFGASRGNGREHRAWDYAFEGGAELSLKGNAKWQQNTAGQWGDNAVFMTPDGTAYRIIHGKFKGTIPATNLLEEAKQDIPDISSKEIAGLNDQWIDLEKRLVGIREQSSSMETEAQFQDVIKKFYPNIPLEGLQDEKALAELTRDAAISGTDNASVGNQMTVNVARMMEEQKQFEKGLNGNTSLNEEEKVRMLEMTQAAQTKQLETLEKKLMLQESIAALARETSALESVNSATENLENRNEILRERTRLEMEGVSGEIIDGEIKKLQLRQQLTEAEKDGVTNVKALREKYEELFDEIDRGVKLQLQLKDPLNNLFARWKKEITDVRAAMAEMASTVASALSGAMTSAITGLIDGTTTAKEAFSDMFKSIGASFIKMATDMIAKALVMKAIGILTSAFSGSGGAGPTPNVSLEGANSIGLTAAPGLAMGGPVTQGQPYVVGERGPELFVPQGSSGNIVPNHALNAYSPGNSNSYGPGQVPVNMSYSGPQLNFNGDEYLPKSAIPELIATAAREGAKQGQARTMKGLRNNRSQRATLGMP